jgi:hypothetical protein
MRNKYEKCNIVIQNVSGEATFSAVFFRALGSHGTVGLQYKKMADALEDIQQRGYRGPIDIKDLDTGKWYSYR